MITLDTNVFVRFLVQDDKQQGAIATTFLESLDTNNTGYICREVIVELVWVLERAYKMPRPKIVSAIEGLLASRELVVEDADRIIRSLDLYLNGGAGFSDRMILMGARDTDCTALATFDKKLAHDEGTILLA